MKRAVNLVLIAIIVMAVLVACAEDTGGGFASYDFTNITNEAPVNFRDFITDFVLLEYAVMVLAAQEDRLWATTPSPGEHSIQANLRVLLKSYDHGDSWEEVYVFPNPIDTVYCDAFGNIFVATTLDRWGSEGTAELFRSVDGGNTFHKVLDIASGAPYHWSIASQNGTMFLSEYGYKGESDNARRIYRSLDFGESWEVVYEPEPMHNYHNHKILIADEVVYQSVGDWPHNKIIRSVDRGETWELAVDGIHPTGAVVFDTHILWGLDSGGYPNSGVARYSRISGEIESFWHPPYPFEGSSYSMAMANGIVYAIFLSYSGDSHPASIFFSRDEGETWEMLGYIDKYPQEGIGLWTLTLDDTFGYIDIQTPVQLEDGERMSRYRGTLRFSLLQ